MNENFKYGAAAVAVVLATIGAIIYITQRKPDVPATETVKAAPAPVKPAPVEEPAVKYPVTAEPAPEPLPTLDQSDAPAFGALGGVLGKGPLEQFVLPQDLIRHVVVTVDNLPNTKAAERLRPLKPAPGRFATAGPEDALTLDPANYERYKPLVEMIRSVDEKQLMALYVRYYPLFQDAYENLGHPPEYFNDRLVEVIDHLLATPDVKDPIALAQPNVQFEFADPKLERRSAGQKALIRMGSANAAVIKAKLRALRAKLVEHPPAN
jgi:hypothetical protein